jgi:acyl carrier protein
MENEVSGKLKTFIIRETLVDDLPLTTYTKIEADLGITGDDAVELINSFGKEFNIDISGFDFSKYFR